MHVGESVARQLASNASDIAHACLSKERTGVVCWLRTGQELNN